MGKDSSAAVTDQQLHEAEEGLVRLLHAKRFPREWIERHVPEAMAQARTDFAVRLAAGREDETVNLLVVIGYRRALKLLSSQTSRPATTSLETIFHLADESTPTPEEEAIEHDREERVAKAMSHLPERERMLMALVYFEGMSIRAAGRRLGGPRAAERDAGSKPPGTRDRHPGLHRGSARFASEIPCRVDRRCLGDHPRGGEFGRQSDRRGARNRQRGGDERGGTSGERRVRRGGRGLHRRRGDRGCRPRRQFAHSQPRAPATGTLA